MKYFIISTVFVPARGKISTTQYTRFQILTTWLLVSDVKEKQSVDVFVVKGKFALCAQSMQKFSPSFVFC
jgi:hypothetical protein